MIFLWGPSVSGRWPEQECVLTSGAVHKVSWRRGLIHSSILQGCVESAAPWPWLGGWDAPSGPFPTWTARSPQPPQLCKGGCPQSCFIKGTSEARGGGGVLACLKSHIWLVAVQGFESGLYESEAPPSPAALCWPVFPRAQGTAGLGGIWAAAVCLLLPVWVSVRAHLLKEGPQSAKDSAPFLSTSVCQRLSLLASSSASLYTCVQWGPRVWEPVRETGSSFLCVWPVCCPPLPTPHGLLPQTGWAAPGASPLPALPQDASHFVAGETEVQTEQVTPRKPQRRGALSVLCVLCPQGLELCLARHPPYASPLCIFPAQICRWGAQRGQVAQPGLHRL